ncbi:multidrug transporter [Paenibacillus swuensis]|uniref:Multidrug transporter n=1 Tax=Paenibacillus swuensis TaxID=1178515 RepID=A0A172THR5_9BACL|nr:DMT family transporter [Paenibacillus swuensis]ANE46323.1 multidrug transporter [Paenibacillus swuensis]
MGFSRNAAYIELTVAAMLVGSSVVVGKLTTMQMPVFLSQSASLAVALVLLIPLALNRRGASLRVRRKDLYSLLLQALLGMFLFRIFMLYGLKFVSAAEAGIVTSMTPAVVVCLSIFMLKEKLTRRLLLGVFCSLAGIISIQATGWFTSVPSVASESSSPSTAPWIGLLLILAAVTGEAMLTILRKMTASHVSSLLGTTYVTFFSFLMFLPFSLVEATQYDWAAAGYRELGLVVYYGIFVTALAYLLWFRGVSKVSAGTAAVFTSCIPLSAMLLSYAVLREPFAWTHLVGGAFVIVGVWQVSSAPERIGLRHKHGDLSPVEYRN